MKLSIKTFKDRALTSDGHDSIPTDDMSFRKLDDSNWPKLYKISNALCSTYLG